MAEVPRVSVIIPNYNYARTLTLCLAALRAQTYPDIEIIVADDCSTDDSVAVAEAAGVKVVQTSGNGGVSVARNLGAEHATGEVLFFLDSDVALEPDAIEAAVGALAGHPEIGGICGVYDQRPLVRDSLVEEYRSLQLHYWQISSEGQVGNVYPAMLAMPAEAYAKVGPFNTRLLQTEDADYGHRITQLYELWLSSAIRGRHDHDHELKVLLRKVFHRTRLRIPLFARRRGFAQGFETPDRAWGSVAALLALGALAAPVRFGWPAAALPALLAAASIGADLGMYRFVLRARGPAFLVFYASMQYTANVTIACGAGVGAVQWLASRKFRRLYDPTPAMVEAGV